VHCQALDSPLESESSLLQAMNPSAIVTPVPCSMAPEHQVLEKRLLRNLNGISILTNAHH
jgi:hypothetical protein